VTRTRIGVALALLALALLTLPGGSSGDSSSPTWAGVWGTDFGKMTLGAGGSGSYEGFSKGTISGHVDGRVNEGTWHQEGDPPKNGTFKFTMSGDGLSFTGEWHYDTGGCGSACGWNGTCTDGPCLKNDDPPPAQPPACGSAAEAFAAAKMCDLGKLPFGSEVSTPAPRRGDTVNISPKPTPASAEEVLAAIRELLLEQERAEILVAINLAGGGETDLGGRDLTDALDGCVLMGEGILGGKAVVQRESRFALLRACARLVLNEATRRAPSGTTAADGCNAVFVPAFPRGRKVTKRKRKRAVATMREWIAVSCKQRRVGKLSFSIRARGKGVTVPDVTGRRLGVKVARRVPKGAPDQRLGVRWQARKR
jgi:hypothetical protein